MNPIGPPSFGQPMMDQQQQQQQQFPTQGSAMDTGMDGMMMRERQHAPFNNNTVNTSTKSEGAPFGLKKSTTDRIKKAIRKLDFYEKAQFKAEERTRLGGFLSAFVLILMSLLMASEARRFFSVSRHDEMSVDQKVDGKMNIFFNITFPRVTCTDLHIDTVDASGEAHIDIHHHIYKHPVSKEGHVLDLKHKHTTLSSINTQKYNPKNDPNSPFYCGSCYGAAMAGTCCNTCSDVKMKFLNSGKPIPPDEAIEQCMHQLSLKHPGCNMYGMLEVNRVSGNFHFAPGRSISKEHKMNVLHLHDFNPLLINRFNASHIIHELSFGDRIPHVQYPLNDLESPSKGGLSLYRYFIKVVPTTYTTIWGTVTHSYQFSYTKYQKDMVPGSMMAFPGIFFVFEFSPIRISYTDYHDSPLHFLVNLCAIVGGIYAATTLFNSLIFNTMKSISKKFD